MACIGGCTYQYTSGNWIPITQCSDPTCEQGCINSFGGFPAEPYEGQILDGECTEDPGSSKSSSLLSSSSYIDAYGCDYEWNGDTWNIVIDYCSVDDLGNPLPYTCLGPPEREGDYLGEYVHVGCQ